MADPRAHVTSIDSLDRFRSSLLVFLERAKLTIDEVSDETNRVRMWLQGEQRMYWTRELKRRNNALDEAQAQLLSAKISALGEATHSHQKAVLRAKMAVKEGEEKLRAVKAWSRHYDSRVAPLTKQLGKLDNLLNGDMQKAAHFLNETIRNLEDYAEVLPPGKLGPGDPPPSSEKAESDETEA
jgi:hypothetical protein